MFTYSGEPVPVYQGARRRVCSTPPIPSPPRSTCRRAARRNDRHRWRAVRWIRPYLLKGKPVFLWNLLDLKRARWEGSEALAPGKHTLEYDFKDDGLGYATLAFNDISGIGRSGTG